MGLVGAQVMSASWAVSMTGLPRRVAGFGHHHGLVKWTLECDGWVLLSLCARLLVPELLGLLAYVVDLLLFVKDGSWVNDCHTDFDALRCSHQSDMHLGLR
jgi:hypothetical protein